MLRKLQSRLSSILMKRQTQGESVLLSRFFSIVLTSLKCTSSSTWNYTLTLTVISYSLLDYGNAFDLKGCRASLGIGEKGVDN